MTGSSRKKLDPIVHSNPWSWIAVGFALHVIGSAAVVHFFKLDAGQVARPVSIVALGMFLALALRWFDRSLELGKWKWWLPPVIYALFIFALSGASYNPGAVPCNTKDFHVVEYGVLGVFLCGAWCSSLPSGETLPLLIRVLPIGILYAASDEIHQSFVPGRTAAVSDVLLDSAALSVGVVVFAGALRVLSRMRKGAPERG